MTNPTAEELLKRNALIARSLPSHPLLSEIPKDAPMPKIFIVTCCDNRVDASELFGLQKWDAVVVRSAAGRMAPHLQNLLFLDQVLNFNEVMIIHHTDCSASMFKNSDVRQVLKERAPEKSAEIDRLVFPGFDLDLEQSIRDDVELVRESPLVRKELAERAHGYLHDIRTGKVTSFV